MLEAGLMNQVLAQGACKHESKQEYLQSSRTEQLSCKIDKISQRGCTHQIPPISSLCSKQSTAHFSIFTCSNSLRALMTGNPAAPAPTMQILILSFAAVATRNNVKRRGILQRQRNSTRVRGHKDENSLFMPKTLAMPSTRVLCTTVTWTS